jgi:hypothetical protein
MRVDARRRNKSSTLFNVEAVTLRALTRVKSAKIDARCTRTVRKRLQSLEP